MRILHLSGARSWGGNEQQLVDSIDGLEKLNVTNFILCLANQPVEKYAIDNNIPHFSIETKKATKRKFIKAINLAVKKFNIDLLHLHTSDVVTSFVLAKMFFGLKTNAVFSKKGIGNSYSVLSIIKYNFKGIKKIICVSKAVKIAFENDVIKPKNHHKLTVVYDGIKIERAKEINPINLKNKFNIKDNVILIGNIANHAKAKDLPTLIKMMNYLINNLNIKNVHLIQIGKKSKYTNELTSLISEYKLDKHISIIGFIPSAMSLIKQFQIYLMSSEREGLPITIYESFYNKVPVVSTNAGGIPEAIIDNYNGFLADCKDYKTLAEKTKLLLENSGLQNIFSSRSYTIILEKFTTKQLTEKTLNIYKEVLNA